MTTAKFYTHEEAIEMMEAMIADNDNNDDSWLDFDYIFGEELEDEDEEIELTDFQVLTLSLLAKEEAILEEWTRKTYKYHNGGSVSYQVDGVNNSYSFNYINNKRIQSNIKSATELITQYKKDLIDSGYKF